MQITGRELESLVAATSDDKRGGGRLSLDTGVIGEHDETREAAKEIQDSVTHLSSFWITALGAQ